MRYPDECAAFSDLGGTVVVAVEVSRGRIGTMYPEYASQTSGQVWQWLRVRSLFSDQDPWSYKPLTSAAREMLAIARAAK